MKIPVLSIFFVCIILSVSLLALENLSSEEALVKRVYAHLTIKDYDGACKEARAAARSYPDSKSIRQATIKALAKAGDEKSMSNHWRILVKKFPEEHSNRELLECMAWGVLERGANSSSPMVRVMAMLGAFFSQDTKGIAILKKNLRDSNSFLRSIALQLSSNLHDAPLRDEVLRRFKTENTWSTRLEAIKAVGKMKICETCEDLVAIISSDHSSAEEKAAAIEALVTITEEIDREKIQVLVKSNRAGLRLLACELLVHFEQRDDVDLLLPLLKDYHAEVRAEALQALGLLRVASIEGHSTADLAGTLIADPDPYVSVAAAWVLTLHEPAQGHKFFRELLRHKESDVRLLAAAALSATGKYGAPLLCEAFKSNADPYVRMNLALGMIGQRIDTTLACDCLYSGLSKEKERWMLVEKGIFQVLAPSKLKHDEAIPNYPEVMDQRVRLNILNTLAILHYPNAQQGIKDFLQERTWGISGLASVLLLTEGDETAVDLVQGLLKDPNHKVKVQASLILALWGRGENAIRVLEEAYPTADRELKEKILEGIGRVGAPSSLPFLAGRLQESYQTLRIIAASALLECLYH
jgi:HEAT repeat protein